MIWPTVPFSEAFSDVTSYGNKVKHLEFQAAGIVPIVDQGQEFIAGYSDDENLAWQEQLPVVVFGDHTRAIKYVDFPFILGADGVKVLLPCNRLNPKFGFYYLQSVSLPSAGYSRHFSSLKRISVPLAPLPEQERIVRLLDAAEELRRLRAAADRRTAELIPALFHQMFGEPSGTQHPVSELAMIAEVVSGVAKGRQFNGRGTVTVPYLRVANVQAGHLNLTEIKTIEALPSEVEELALKRGDVLLTEGGDFDKLGRGALWEADIPNCIHQNHIFRVRVEKSRLLPIYFASFLQTPIAKDYFLRCSKKTTNLASINMTQLRRLPVLVPPLTAQRQFAVHVAEIRALETQQAASRRRLDDLFQSMLHRAFQGEL